ncbi:cation-translocating P-type ATPase [Niastella caeni]|uniref:Cation-translocating P-type ATPase n=1 Tax=Niastella caeni TaxID=2569763 RepID=A0A4S8HVB1_9BACT|nr:cation-translocating P-type ATPase [Niastella caeni]THU39530.1 cation-translocating P-type ATPase [Niastella caeni]
MPGKVTLIENIQGLAEKDIPALQQQHGKNSFQLEKPRQLLHILTDIIREPMFILLMIACIAYFILGQSTEGIMMLVAICFVTAISLYQDVRSTRALQALKQFTEPEVTVIRDGVEKKIRSEELVPGDVIILEEGNKVPADATILQENDLSVNESVITGESMPADKDEASGKNVLYQGTTINTGKCYAAVTATGSNTILGKLGKTVSMITAPKTLLQTQVNRFVRQLAIFGISAFLLIWMVNYLKNGLPIQSLLFALTLAMAAVPEEIPVAFSSFLALGAWQMSKLGIITRQPQTIENLGAVNVICLDKTGTITENKMTVKTIYDFEQDALIDAGEKLRKSGALRFAAMASEQNPFDAMEKAILETLALYADHDLTNFPKQVYEYPLAGNPPMMTHIFYENETYVAAAKGAPERIIKACRLNDDNAAKIIEQARQQAQKGYRVIGVASAVHTENEFPNRQDDFNWKFKGLLCLYDPPRENIAQVLKQFYDAQIDIKLLTGDFAETAINICQQVGITGYLKYVTGDQVLQMHENELKKTVEEISLFVRMFPEAKQKVVNALKSNGHIVAMTGDGVNDAPALKASDIGIALGKKGTEMARQAADLIVTDDDLEKVAEALKQGRKIFNNLKKAIRYIISIHIPIILTASVPLLLGWKYPNIFTPIHVIFLELIMGPTCSVFFEREPVEEQLMSQSPRKRSLSLFQQGELLLSIMQGLIITSGVLLVYYLSMYSGDSINETRTMVFTTLIISNVFLTFANRSFTENIIKTIRYKNRLARWLLLISVLFLAALHLIPPVREIFGLAPVQAIKLFLCVNIALLSVGWFEVYKTHRFKPGKTFISHKH